MKSSHLTFVMVAVFAFFTAALSAQGNAEKDKALAEIKNLGGVLVPFPFSVSFGAKGVTDDGLVHLKKLPDLEALYLRKCNVTDAGMKNLSGLTKLQYLYLGQTEVTDKGLENLKGMTKLKALSLIGTQVTDKGLVNLKGLKSLQTLEIKDTQITDAGVATLKKSLPKLFVRKYLTI